MLEIELKARIDRPEHLNMLLETKAEFLHSYRKEDLYFRIQDAPDIRIRVLNDGSGLLTRKTKEIIDGIETSIEDESKVDRPEFFFQLCRDLELEVHYSKVKTGKAYRYKGMLLEFSEIQDLGWYLEIEWTGECSDDSEVERQRTALQIAASDFGITPENYESRPYSELLLSRK
ncbi:class IV adenylate cyclase [Spirochaeta dissipatitropha]